MKIVKKGLMFALAACLTGIPAIPASAQETAAPVQRTVEQIRTQQKETVEKARTERVEIRTDAKAQFNVTKEGVRTGSTTKDAIMADRKARVEALKENQAKFKTAMEARRKELSAKLKENKEARSVKLEIAAKQRINVQLGNIFNRLNQHLEKTIAIDARIAERLNAMDEEGKNVEAAAEQYVKAQAALGKARTDIAAAKALTSEQTATTSPAVSKEALRTLVKTADESLKAALVEYRKVVELLKVSVRAEAEVTTEAEVESEATAADAPASDPSAQ